ncbi:MAG: hypothetical protein JRF32_10250 [Deltaproteobacteria bacterium]|nr:hypothetical protein [Deltaproteobacteria bacterium]
MQKNTLEKALSNNIGRNFNLVFNQVAMYNAQHKSGAQAIDRFFDALTDGLKQMAPLAISLHQEQFFVEEEPFAQRINTTRMATHFKKVGIESISFENNLSREDLVFFLEIIIDLNTYASIDAMKKALDARTLTSVRMNYVTFRKITEDEEVVKRDQQDGKPAGLEEESPDNDSALGGMLDIMVANIVSDEIGKNISIQKMLAGPAELSTLLIDSDLAAVGHPKAPDLEPGTSLVQGLQQFHREVDEAMAAQADLSIADLARGVFELKNKLIKGIEDQKTKGIVYVDESTIRKEADEITDSVLVRLITEEYNQGAVSVKRLAGIIIRLVPAADELRRILPKAKQALLASGMALSEFFLLVQELKQELQSDELARALERGAGEIGLDGEELVQEIMDHPEQAAELICLAAEIRKGGTDAKALSELLVDYVEGIGSDLAVKELEASGGTGGENAQRVFSRIRSELVDNLKTQQLETDVLSDIEKRLTDRMEASLRQLKARMLFKQVSTRDAHKLTKDSVLKMLQSYSEDEREFNEILEQVKTALSEKGVGSEHFDHIYDDMMAEMEARQQADPAKKVPTGTLNRQSALFVLENEIKRSSRYHTPFSVLSFSIIKASPRQAAEPKGITLDDVVQSFMTGLVGIVRETDIVGRLSLKMIMVLQPMTRGPNSKIALDRVSKGLKACKFKVKGVPFDIQFAGVTTPFEHEKMLTLKALIQTVQRDLKSIATRLSNLQSMM